MGLQDTQRGNCSDGPVEAEAHRPVGSVYADAPASWM